MNETVEFDEDWQQQAPPSSEFVLDIEGFEGPIDVLLQLARDQKVDLTRISILALADQYLAFIRAARRVRLELAADYLVMAAWLAYLKSRLLLPEPEGEEEPSGAEMAAALKFQLQRLQSMRDAGHRLMNRPHLDRDFFRRGDPQKIAIETNAVIEVSLYDLLSAYGSSLGRIKADSLRIAPLNVYSVEDALERLKSMLGEAPGWRSLFSFLPEDLRGSLHRRSAVASTFAASLEMVREGQLQLRQDGVFGPIYLRGAS